MTDIQLTISVEEANQILAALGEQPFAQVYTLITKIQRQAQGQLADGESVGASTPETPPAGGPSDDG